MKSKTIKNLICMYIFFKRLHIYSNEENLIKHPKRYKLFIRRTLIGQYHVDYQKSFQILKEIADAFLVFKNKGRDVFCLRCDEDKEEFIRWECEIYKDDDRRNQIDIIGVRHKLKYSDGHFFEEDFYKIDVIDDCEYDEKEKCFNLDAMYCNIICLKYDFRYNAWRYDDFFVLDFSDYNL